MVIFRCSRMPMSLFIDHRREKQQHAIAFFTRNTRRCHTVKLFKLLYFFDFEHYRQTGRSVTGFTYKALSYGPVPAELYREIENRDEMTNASMEVRETFGEFDKKLTKREFRAKVKFDETYFTKRELEIMGQLAEVFAKASAEDMSAVSHAPKFPWSKIYKGGKGTGRMIPYALALESKAIVGDAPAVEAEHLAMLEDVFGGVGLR